MTAEEFLNKFHNEDDYNILEEQIKDSLWTNNVLVYMKEYARLKCFEAVKNVRYKCENIIEEWTDAGNPNIKIALAKIEDLKDEELLPTF